MNIRIELIRQSTSFNAAVEYCTSMACNAALVLVVSCTVVTLTVVILIMIALTSTLIIILRHSLRISIDTPILMGINIRAHVYQHLYGDED